MDPQIQDIILSVGVSSVALMMLVVLLINLLLISLNRRLKHKTHVLGMRTYYEKELIKTQIEVAESTLNDIARDLHDDVGQMLTFSIIQLNNIVSDNPVLENKITEVRDTVHKTLQSVRSISKTLSNDYLTSFGIFQSLDQLCERLVKQGIEASFVFPKELLFRSKSNELFTFRIIQELINNTLKHSGATEIKLNFTDSSNSIRMQYQDNGRGFDAEVLKKENLKNSLGFINIYLRAELMNASLKVRTEQGAGFYFELQIPNE